MNHKDVALYMTTVFCFVEAVRLYTEKNKHFIKSYYGNFFRIKGELFPKSYPCTSLSPFPWPKTFIHFK